MSVDSKFGSLISGALIGGVASRSVAGALLGSLSSLAFYTAFSQNERGSGRKMFISAVAFAAIKLSIDHVLPNHQIVSSCIGLIPTGRLGPNSMANTFLAALAGTVGSVFSKQIGLTMCVAAEVICGVALGGYFRDRIVKIKYPSGGLYNIPLTFLFTAAAIASIICTNRFNPSLDLLTNAGTMAIPFLITHFCWYRIHPCIDYTNKTILRTAIPIYVLGFGYHFYKNPLQALKWNVLYTIAVLTADHFVFKKRAHLGFAGKYGFIVRN